MTHSTQQLNAEKTSYATGVTSATTSFFDRIRRLRRNESFADRDYRHAINEVEIRRGVRAQIKAMRESRGWSQETLGKAIGKPQNNISRIENGREGYLSVATLLDLARAFDVGLAVRFVPFSDVFEWVSSYSSDNAAPASYEQEVASAARHADTVASVTSYASTSPLYSSATMGRVSFAQRSTETVRLLTEVARGTR